MKKLTQIVLIIILVVLGWYIWQSQAPAVRTGSITVGAILPLTGDYGALGESIERAMELSASTLPAGKVKLVFEDDRYDAKTGLSAYQKLSAADHADIIVAISSPTIEVVKSEIEKHKQLLFILGDELTHEVDRTFQLMPQGAGLFSRLGAVAGERYRSVAVVFATDNKLFQSNAELFTSGLPSGVAVQNVPVQAGSDMRTEATRVATAQVDAYTLFLPLEGGLRFVREMAKYSSRPAMICDPNIELAVKQYVERVGTQFFDGCISVMMKDTKTADFVNLYTSKIGGNPQFGSDYGYDVVQVIGRLADRPRMSWVTYLSRGFTYQGMSGLVAFDKTGTRPAEAEVHVFRDGVFQKLDEKSL